MSAKDQIRRQVISIRNSLHMDFINTYSAEIVSEIIKSEEYLSAKVIFLYLNAFNEVSLDNLISKSWELKKTVCVPLANKGNKTMTANIINSWDDLVIGAYGIREPKSSLVVSPKDIELIFIPAVAYDYDGFRLGMGAGYYDKYTQNLSPHTIKFGVCWSFQVVEDIFHEEHDLFVDTILTEQKIIKCQKGKM